MIHMPCTAEQLRTDTHTESRVEGLNLLLFAAARQAVTASRLRESPWQGCATVDTRCVTSQLQLLGRWLVGND